MPEVYNNTRGFLCVPPAFEMVMNIITAVECGTKPLKINSLFNAFIKSKKLALSAGKCAKVHVGKI